MVVIHKWLTPVFLSSYLFFASANSVNVFHLLTSLERLNQSRFQMARVSTTYGYREKMTEIESNRRDVGMLGQRPLTH